MKIETASIFKMTFLYEGTELMIPMAAATQAEAMQKLKTFMEGWVKELTPLPTPVPTLSPVQLNEEKPPDPMVLAMRIEEMVKQLIPLKKPKGAQSVERLVKEWTGFPYEPQNYASIIAELARLNVAQ